MKLIRSLLLLLIIVVVVVVLAFDQIAKYVITKYGSQELKTPISLSQVKTSFSKKSLNINAIKVQNPAGFKAKNALSLDNFKMIIADDTTSSLIVIKEIVIDNISTTIEQNAKNINIMLLSSYLKNNNKNLPTNKKNVKSSQKNKTKVIVQNFLITGGNIIIDTKLIKKTIKLPKFQLQNIGGKDGVSVENIGKHLMDLILEKIKNEVAKNGFSLDKDKIKKSILNKISNSLGLKADTLDKLKDKVGTKVNKFKQDLVDKTEIAKKDVADKTNEVKNKLKDMFKF